MAPLHRDKPLVVWIGAGLAGALMLRVVLPPLKRLTRLLLEVGRYHAQPAIAKHRARSASIERGPHECAHEDATLGPSVR